MSIEELERLAKASLNGLWYDGNPDPKTILKLINRLRDAEKERDSVIRDILVARELMKKRFNEGLRQGQANMDRALQDISKAKDEYYEANQAMTNQIEELEKERDEFKARIDGGVRVYAFNEEGRYEAIDLVDERNLKHNATLIIDYGVEI